MTRSGFFNLSAIDILGQITMFCWRRKWQSTLVFLLGKSHGQRILAGHSPWGCKESDMTEHTHNLILETVVCVVRYSDSSVVKNLPANAGDVGSIPGLGMSPGEGNGSSLQCSCVGNTMDSGAWWAAVCGVVDAGHNRQWQQAGHCRVFSCVPDHCPPGGSRPASVWLHAQPCLTLRPCGLQPDRLPRSWDLPGESTGVGCHFKTVPRCCQVTSGRQNHPPVDTHWLCAIHFTYCASPTDGHRWIGVWSSPP